MVKLSILTSYYLLLTPFLYAVEGNEPVPEIELPLPKQEEETLRITSPLKFPSFYIGTEVGESEIGKGYEIKFDAYPWINNAFGIHILEIGDKISIKGGAGNRFIGSQSIVEVNAEVGSYKVGNWNKFGIINGAVSLYLGENIFKSFGSWCYENEQIWDLGVLLGRRFLESVFVGLGVSGPRYITPFIQINWAINPAVSMNISHRSKEVTTTLDNLYMNQPYVIYNPVLKHDRWTSFSTIKFILHNNTAVEIIHKSVRNTIYWDWYPHIGVKPINIKSGKEYEGKLTFGYKKIRNTLSIKYIPIEPILHEFRLSYTQILSPPNVVVINELELCLPYEIKIKLEKNYVGERNFYRFGEVSEVLDNYLLFALGIAKKLNNLELWCRVNNLTNTKYEIIKGINRSGICFQVGIELTII